MAEGVYAKLKRVFTGATIPPFQRNFIGRLFRSEHIGDISVSTWAKRILKSLGDVKMQEASGEWNPPEDEFDITSVELAIYNYQKRIKMNRTALKLFDKNGILPVGMDELGNKASLKMNYNLFRGKKAYVDQFPKTQYNYITEGGGDGSSYSQPKILTQATAGHWKAGDHDYRMTDISRLIGQAEVVGYNPATSIVFYPEVTGSVMREALGTKEGSGGKSTMQFIKEQGLLGAVAVKDELLYTAAGANPTAALFDLYLVDMSQVILGWTIPENTDVIYDPISKRTLVDFEAAFAPFFIPKKYDDTNEYIYKGVSRITAIDTSS